MGLASAAPRRLELLDGGAWLSLLCEQTPPLHHPLHSEIETQLNAGAFDDAQRLLAQLGVGEEHVHATTYFATRILYQRGKLDLAGVTARLVELLRSCPDFPEARAMLRAAEQGTLRRDPHSFNQATFPPAPATLPPTLAPPPLAIVERFADEDERGDRQTQPARAPSSLPLREARLETPLAPGIPRAPPLPNFTPRQNALPSYAPELDLDLTPPSGLDLDLFTPASSTRPSDTVSAPPPSSERTLSPPPGGFDLGPLDDGTGFGGKARSTAPSPAFVDARSEEPPSVFAIATWLAERDFERALAAVQELGPEKSPELSLLEVRASVGLGRKAAARRSLDRLCRAPLLDPDLRAASARLLLDLGDVARAEAQARRAHAEDPRSDLSRLTLAWAIAKSAGWLLSPRATRELEALLGGLDPDGCALPQLGYALRALMLTQRAPEAARQAVEAALTRDPNSLDALAIGAVVAQQQGRSPDAQRLYQRLSVLDHHAAEELSATLEGLARPLVGDDAPVTARAAAPGMPRARAAAMAHAEPTPWEDKENRLAAGDGRAALFDFEQGLSRRLEGIPARASAGELSWAAMITARYLTQAPITRHFSAFDLSLFSIARLDAALALIYRSAGPRTELRARVLVGLGAYAGECVRQAYAGEWIGNTTDLLRLHVEAQGQCFASFRDVDARLQLGEPLAIADNPVAHPGAEPLGQRVALDVAPPAPWDPAIWPEPNQLRALGGQLQKSPVGLYCASVELPLDLSFASLRSLDRYVTLLAPPLAPPDPEAVWVRRAAVLVGAYLGEVLRATRGGTWETHGELRAEAYRVLLPGGAQALPVAAAFERLSGRRLEQPSDYARRITG